MAYPNRCARIRCMGRDSSQAGQRQHADHTATSASSEEKSCCAAIQISLRRSQFPTVVRPQASRTTAEYEHSVTEVTFCLHPLSHHFSSNVKGRSPASMISRYRQPKDWNRSATSALRCTDASQCKSHCTIFAVSDGKHPEFATVCHHTHDSYCQGENHPL